MRKGRLATFIGNGGDRLAQLLSQGVFSNADFETVAMFDYPDSENIGRSLTDGIGMFPVYSCERAAEFSFDTLLLMDNNEGDLQRAIKTLTEEHNVAISKLAFTSSLFFLPFSPNLGTIEIDPAVTRGKWIDFHYLLSRRLVKPNNDLEDFFIYGDHVLISKWLHYFEIYERYFSKFRDREITMLEIGVFKGGSLELWKNYFGDKARIVGVDIALECKKHERENISIEIGSQEEPFFLKYLVDKYGCFDIVLDDGGHTMRQQNMTFSVLYPAVSPGGIYMCEDCHTSYWKEYGGGYRKEDSFIEQSKKRIDGLNIEHIRDDGGYIPEMEATDIKSIHFYDSVVVYEKGLRGHSFSLNI